ncbi:MAG: response regulator [Verrucomicrobia bacterium]|nr:response regulator [Verrucomicrobiota bacterium]
MNRRLRIIHLEDDPNDRELVRNLLEAEGLMCEFHHVETRDDFTTALEQGPWDLIMSDFTLPGYDGLSALALARQKRPEVPYLFVSGTMGEELAVDSLQHGATDYVLKNRLNRLVAAVRRALQEAEDRQQRLKAELLREAFLDLGSRLNSSSTPPEAARIILDAAQQLLGWDAGALEMYSAPQNATRPVLAVEMVLGRRIDVPHVATFRPLTPRTAQCLAQGGHLIPAEDTRSAEQAGSPGSGGQLSPSSLLVPVRHGAKTIGFLSIEKFTRPGYTKEDLKTLLALADHCGGALERIAVEEEKDRLLAEIQSQQQRLDNILAGVPAVVWETWRAPDAKGQRTNFVSRHVETMLGYTVQEWLATPDLWLRIVHPEDKQRVYQEIDKMYAMGQGLTHQYRWVAKDGRIVWVETSAVITCREDGTPIGLRGVTMDITEKKKIEAQFLRSQRIESIGRLTSGIAHDLNNVLAPILMSAQVLRERLQELELQNLVSITETHAKRAADIVKQLLTFARGTECERTLVQPKLLLDEMVQTLQHTLPKSIAITAVIQPDAWLLSANPTQLQQVILNLCVNARDAMPNGGSLALSAANVVLDETTAQRHPGAKPGAHVMIRVVDTGLGIAPEILDKIFDPFFTTKDRSKGTGLGLSTMLGIVRNHGGFVTVESELGSGSQFAVYLPASPSATPLAPNREEPSSPSGNGETILVVDDEMGIREMARQILRHAGFNVIVAADGAEAIAKLDQHGRSIELVLSDIMMPVMDGVALTRAIRKLHSHVKVIASTGFGIEDKLAELRALAVTQFLEKPYSAEKLLGAIHRALHSPA